jgi:hypothetical protein
MIIEQFIGYYGDICRKVRFRNRTVLISAQTRLEAKRLTREWIKEVAA